MGYSYVGFACFVLAVNLAYVVWREIEKHMLHKQWVKSRADWRQFLVHREEIKKLNLETKEIIKQFPDMQKPKLMKLKGVPALYGKKVKVRQQSVIDKTMKTGLYTIDEMSVE